jgi:predicted  nucleic acid-binding Zn-ribbon protein
VLNKDSAKDVAEEEPSGSSKGWKESLTSKIWESEQAKVKRLQNEIADLKGQLATKNTEMQRQKQEHKSTSSKLEKSEKKHTDLVVKYNSLVEKYNNLLDDITNERGKTTTLRKEKSSLESINNNLMIDYKKLSGEKARLENGTVVLKGELEEERLYIQELKAKLNEREEEIAKGHADAIKKLTESVSSSVTDNQMARELTSFFANCYEEWAMEHCIGHLEDTNRIEMELLQSRLLRGDHSIPQEFNFDVSDPTAPAIVLQAYLSKALCDIFFDNPYFLIALAGEKEIKDETSDGRGLSRIEHWQGATPSKKSDTCAANRIQERTAKMAFNGERTPWRGLNECTHFVMSLLGPWQ